MKILTNFHYDFAIWPHFYRYYKALGFTKFVVGMADMVVPGFTEDFLSRYAAPDVQVVPLSRRFATTQIEGNNKEEMRQLWVDPDEIFSAADIDEFVKFPLPVKDLADQLRASQHGFVVGFFVDRLAPDGELLPTPPPDQDIFQAYPIEADISRLTRCCNHKVIMAKGHVRLGPGHHNAVDRSSCMCSDGIIHHFKWRAGVVEALQRRIAVYQRQDVPWWPESQRVLDYLKEHDGRIKPEDFRRGRR